MLMILARTLLRRSYDSAAACEVLVRPVTVLNCSTQSTINVNQLIKLTSGRFKIVILRLQIT